MRKLLFILGLLLIVTIGWDSDPPVKMDIDDEVTVIDQMNEFNAITPEFTGNHAETVEVFLIKESRKQIIVAELTILVEDASQYWLQKANGLDLYPHTTWRNLANRYANLYMPVSGGDNLCRWTRQT